MKPHKVSSRAKLAPVLYGDPVLRSFQCEDEGSYLAYVTEIRDTQMGGVSRPIPQKKNERAADSFRAE